MHRFILIGFAALFMLGATTALAGTIYTWTDADGVKRYANSPPPEDVANVQTIDEVQYDDAGADRQRQEFERMVEDASREADRHFDRQAGEKARQAAARKRREQSEQNLKVEAERARLMKEIEAIEQRGYSPTFTQGMKENLIKQVQDKIDQLESGAGN